MKTNRRAHLHDAIDLLGLAGEPEALEKHAQRRQQIDAVEVERPHVLVQHRLVELLVLAQELADLLLVQQARRAEEPRHFAGCRLVREQSCALFHSVLSVPQLLRKEKTVLSLLLNFATALRNWWLRRTRLELPRPQSFTSLSGLSTTSSRILQSRSVLLGGLEGCGLDAARLCARCCARKRRW